MILSRTINKVILLLILAVSITIPRTSFAALQVNTLLAENITPTSATLGGRVSDPDAQLTDPPTIVDLYGRFRFSTDAKNKIKSCETMVSANDVDSDDPLTGLDFYNDGFYNFSKDMDQLQTGVEYFYCAMVSSDSDFSNPDNIVYGNVIRFTPEEPPDFIDAVITDSVTGLSETEATLNGTVIETNPGTLVWWRFRYSTTPGTSCSALANANNTPTLKSKALGGSVKIDIKRKLLKEGTTYYYCAMAATNSGFLDAVYGLVESFTTPLSPGSVGTIIGPVTTLTTTLLDDDEVTLNGNYTGGAPGYAYFRLSNSDIPPIFCNDIYGSRMIGVTANNPDPIGYMTSSGGDFSVHVNGLEAETDYYYCAVVSNSAYWQSSRPGYDSQIKYGEVGYFRTPPCESCYTTSVTTTKSRVRGSTSATLYGEYKSSRAVDLHFEYAEVNPDPTSLQANGGWVSTPTESHGVNSRGSFSYTVNGLKKNTQYKFQAIAKAADGSSTKTAFGGILEFKTDKFDGLNIFSGGGNGSGYTTGGGTTGGGGVIITTGDDNCPAGTTGTFPACVPVDNTNDPDHCQPGWIGNPPKCFPGDPNNTGNPIPTVKVTASPLFINPGESSVISWTSSNVKVCKLNGYDADLSGAAGTGPLDTSHVYTVDCVGPYGSASDSAEVYVNITGDTEPPGGGDVVWVSVTASPSFITPDQEAIISWTSSGAQFCDTHGHATGTSGSFPTGTLPLGTTSFSVTCSGKSGTDSDTAYVVVYDPELNNGNSGSGGGSGGSGGGSGGNGGGSGGNSGGNGGSGGGSGGSGGNSFPPGPGNPWVSGGGNGGSLTQTPDIDGDGTNNWSDDDIDGDWDPNVTDTDDDGDGVPDFVDPTPSGPGNSNDFDGGGLDNNEDTDMDGDGVPNYLDNDTDGDGVPNALDLDDDSDGIPDLIDPTPKGPHGDRASDILVLGEETAPPVDAIVRYHEGIETVFARQIRGRTDFASRYGYNGGNIVAFGWDLAHLFAKFYFGYIDENNLEVRVSAPDVSAYELRQVGNTLVVYEYYKNKIIDIRSKTVQFKQKNPYEYYFRRIFQ